MPYELHKACRNLDVKKVQTLLEEDNSNVNQHDEHGVLPLHRAIVISLLVHSDEKHSAYANNYYSLYDAERTIQIVKLLLDNEADPSLTASAPTSISRDSIYGNTSPFIFLLNCAISYSHSPSLLIIQEKQNKQYLRFRELISLFLTTQKFSEEYIHEIGQQLCDYKFHLADFPFPQLEKKSIEDLETEMNFYKESGYYKVVDSFREEILLRKFFLYSFPEKVALKDGWVGNIKPEKTAIAYLLKDFKTAPSPYEENQQTNSSTPTFNM